MTAKIPSSTALQPGLCAVQKRLRCGNDARRDTAQLKVQFEIPAAINRSGTDTRLFKTHRPPRLGRHLYERHRCDPVSEPAHHAKASGEHRFDEMEQLF